MTKVTVGEAIVRVLEAHNVDAMYGVISIHNLPIADAVGRRESMKFVCARGEAGAVTMSDAHARFKGIGVSLTSTGAGAGNGIGSLIEAYQASSPLIHITGQVEREYLDRDASFIHEAKDQLTFLRASSKAAYRIMDPDHAVGMLREAIRVAQTVPMGPVSIEIPIDVQATEIDLPADLGPVAPLEIPKAGSAAFTELVEELKKAKRPLLWIGGGTIGCEEEVKTLADLGIPVVSSTHARGVLSDNHPRSLGAFHNSKDVETLMAESDLMVVVGSRLRSNETKTYSIKLSDNLYQIDAFAGAQQRNYKVKRFICAAAKEAFSAMIEGLNGVSKVDTDYDAAIKAAKASAVKALRDQLEDYALICDAVRDALPEDGIFVRDITMSGSTWGSRLLPIYAPNRNIHSLAGAIGLGLAHGIGASIANPDKKVISLVGDGGLMLGIGEIATMFQEQTDMVLLVMNDGGYGVMRGIQNNYFEGRQYFNELHTPSYRALGESMGVPSFEANSVESFREVIQKAVEIDGPAVVEVLMNEIGPLNFAGPPQRKLY